MRDLIKKYMIEGDAITAWLILKAPLPVALIYLYQAIKGDLNAIMITVFFFPYVFLLIKNLWLEILHAELVTKLKIESGLEIQLHKKRFKITRFTIVALGIAEIYLIPHLLNLSGAPKFSEVPVIIVVSRTLILTLSAFLFQIRFSHHVGRLLYVLETKRKFDPLKELNSEHRIKILNPVAFGKCHDRIKRAVGSGQ